MYGAKGENQNISLPLDELQASLRQIPQGLLSTSLFTLHDGQKTYLALIKEVQYHPVSYAILHVDFLAVSDKEAVSVNVPIQIVGLADCPGIKLGGFMRQPIRFVKVSCLPKEIPPRGFLLDVSSLNVGESRRLSDLSIPPSVKPLAKMAEVVAVIAKKA